MPAGQYAQNLCVKTNTSCAPCPTRLPSCVGLRDGAQSDPTHPWSPQFIECFMNRTMTTRQCRPGEYFHPRLNQCTKNIDPGVYNLVDPLYCKLKY